MVRDDFTADLRLVRKTMLRMGVWCGAVGWGGGGISVICICFLNLESTVVRDDFTADLRLAVRSTMLRVMVWWDGGGIFVIIFILSQHWSEMISQLTYTILRVKVRVELSLFCIISF